MPCCVFLFHSKRFIQTRENKFLALVSPQQIVKNLVFLAKTLQLLELQNEGGGKHGQENEECISAGDGTTFSLATLLSNMNKLATQEASQTPKQTQKVGINSTCSFLLM